MPAIPHNRPRIVGTELDNIREAIANRHLAGDGPFTRRCSERLAQLTGAPFALLTHSCTAALEMAALLLNVQPGDEVILPSYTFSSTANAFALRGATLVFVDVREDTLNLDERLVADAVTSRTRVIVPVHYAGVACDMSSILNVAKLHDIAVVEDAAQGVGSRWNGQALGSIGDFGCLSFHESKNIVAGEGGALLLRGDAHLARAEVIREKGTNRSRFFRGEVDKYTWTDVGSSYLPSDMIAAFLLAQLDAIERIQLARLRIWATYHEAMEPLEREGLVQRPVVPIECEHNAHLYAIRVSSLSVRTVIMQALVPFGVRAISHYVPLHSSPAGVRLGRTHGALSVTDRVSETLLRLPLWPEMLDSDVECVVSAVSHAVNTHGVGFQFTRA